MFVVNAGKKYELVRNNLQQFFNHGATGLLTLFGRIFSLISPSHALRSPPPCHRLRGLGVLAIQETYNMKVVKPTSLVLSCINISRRSSALSASTRALRLCAFRCAMGTFRRPPFDMARHGSVVYINSEEPMFVVSLT